LNLFLSGFISSLPQLDWEKRLCCCNEMQVLNKVSGAVKGMVRTIKYPVVWKPSLYMFLSLALSISTHEGQFYWYTNKTPPNPGFSQVKVVLLTSLMTLLISRSVNWSNDNFDLQHNSLVLHHLNLHGMHDPNIEPELQNVQKNEYAVHSSS